LSDDPAFAPLFWARGLNRSACFRSGQSTRNGSNAPERALCSRFHFHNVIRQPTRLETTNRPALLPDLRRRCLERQTPELKTGRRPGRRLSSSPAIAGARLIRRPGRRVPLRTLHGNPAQPARHTPPPPTHPRKFYFDNGVFTPHHCTTPLVAPYTVADNFFILMGTRLYPSDIGRLNYVPVVPRVRAPAFDFEDELTVPPPPSLAVATSKKGCWDSER